MKTFAVCLFAVLGVALAVTKEEVDVLKTASLPFIISCREEFGISKEDLLAAKGKKDIDAIDSCFYACFFKKTGIMNEAGTYLPEVFVEKNKKFITNADSISEITTIANACAHVNDESVSDGEKGCERAKLLLACYIKEKGSFTPFI